MPENNNQNIQNNKTKMSQKKKYIIIIAVVVSIIFLTSASVFAYQVYVENTLPDERPWCNLIETDDCRYHPSIDKPVIYLYPTKTTDVKVELNYNGKLISTYPSYDKNISGWQVIAKPDGNLINIADGKEYSYLFWEGIGNTNYSKFDNGFVVKGSQTKDFLQSSLAKIGLTPREYNEMIVYWLPKMENNNYNLIRFAGQEYIDSAKLTVTPTPDSILRVFMVFKPLDKYQPIPTQQLQSFNRKGFAVVEWGGTEIK